MPATDNAAIFILWQAATSATPLVLAGYGELIAQRAGVINVGIEGTMLMGAVAAYATAIITGSGMLGILAAAGVGILVAFLFALVSIWCRADQVVAGTAINILASGTSATLSAILQAHPPADLPPTAHPFFDRLSLPGNQYALTYLVLLMGIALWLFFRFTRAGLTIQALGDSPAACQSAGMRVRVWRTGCVLFAGACAGVAGSFLSIMALHDFHTNMTDGRGFLVLALVIFGRWSLPGLVLGTLMFGAVDAYQMHLSSIPGLTDKIPPALFSMLPYLATLIALALLSRSSAGPIYLGRPWPPTEPEA